MEPIILAIVLLSSALLIFIVANGILHKFNTKIMSYVIVGTVLLSVILLVVFYNAHPECDAIINHNNMTLQVLQDKCYQYINY